MSNSAEPQQVFVRNDKGRLWGPITPQTLELLLENNLIEGRIQISIDGINFAFPVRFPDLRKFVPRELWGDGTGAPPPPAAAPAGALIPPPPPAPGATPPTAGPTPGPPPVIAGPGTTRPGVLNAGPGAAPIAGPGAVPVAGPGTRQPPVVRAGPDAAAAQQARTSPNAPNPASAAASAPTPSATSAATATPAPFERKSGPPPSGDLAAISPVRLYYLAASSDQTGLLSLRLSDRTIEIHFRKGNPEYVSSNHPEDALTGFLLSERLATREQIAQAEGALHRFGGDLIAALFGTGILNPANAFSHLAQRAHGLLMKGLLAFSGTFEFVPKELPPHKAMPLGNRWAVLMDLVRRVPIIAIRHRLADVADNPVMKSGGQVALSELRLTPQETRAASFIDGVRSLNLLARDFPQDADVFFRLAWALREMDIVSFAAVKLPTAPPSGAPNAAAKPQAPAGAPGPTRPTAPSAGPGPRPGAPVAGPGARPATPTAAPVVRPASPPAQRPAAPRPPAAPPSAAPAASAPAPAAPANYEAELKTLRATHAGLKEQNKFQVLGLTEQADASAVKAAYFKLAKLYHPDTVPPDAPAELGKLKADLFAAIGDAYRTLSDDASRARYLEDLKAGGAGDVDVAAILHAEELFQKGCILVKAKKFEDAITILSDAINTNPEEGEFYAWRGIARFYANPDKKAGSAEADRDFGVALRKNPRCAQAYFFQGQMAKLLGDSKKALQHFQKTLELQPDHLDAQREIRYLSKK